MKPSLKFVVCAGGLALACLSSSALSQSEQKLLTRHSPIDGRLGFLAADDGRSALTGADGQPLMSAEALLSVHGARFGITDPDEQLILDRTDQDNLNWTTTTYRQVHESVPVFSGVFKVHQNAAGEVVAANGDFYEVPAGLDTRPTITEEQAIDKARFTTSIGRPEVEKVELVIVDPAWYGDSTRFGVRLAYHVVLTDLSMPYSLAHFIDAHNGQLLDKWNTLHSARDRRVHDGMGTDELPGTPARFEGDPATGDADIDAAYDYYGDTYDYFFRAFGRDSIDDAGMPMVATTHSTAPGCPNAFWSSGLGQMVFCDGTVTDDIVGHELTHGVTSNTANLIYQNQPGQLNEAMSDIFGELIDLFNGDAAFVGTPGGTPWPDHPTGPGLDEPNGLRTACSFPPAYDDGVRWLLGEDATVFGGAIRDMWAPPCMGDPAHANDTLQVCNIFDAGGVHSGSGVPNHAFAIMTDGKSFNGYNVAGIGPIKAGAVWYRALTTYLTVGSDFQEAYWALNQAATDLIGTVPNDPRTGAPSGDMFTSFDAEQVDLALRAVEMNTPGLCGEQDNVLSSDPAPDCGPTNLIYSDDFESGAPGWTVENSAPPTPFDWALTSDLPFLRPGTAYFVQNGGFTGADEAGTHTLRSPAVVLPAGTNFPVLSFDHLMQCERRWDGGLVRIIVNGGPAQVIPAEDFFYNSYNQVLLTDFEFSNNPYAGSPAFSGFGGTWGTSLAYLGNFAGPGDEIRIEFVFAKDFCCGNVGWMVDDVAVFDCSSESDCNDNGVPDSMESGAGDDRVVVWSRKPILGNAFWSDADVPLDQSDPQFLATLVRLTEAATIEQVRVWGVYTPDVTPPAPDFTVVFREHDPGSRLPGAVIASESGVSTTREPTGRLHFGVPEQEITLDLGTPLELPPGVYWVQVHDNTADDDDSFNWSGSSYTQGFVDLAASRTGPPATDWFQGLQGHLSLELLAQRESPLCAGDANNDGEVTLLDVTHVIFRFGVSRPGCGSGDVNGDGILNYEDITYVLFRMGECEGQ